MYKTSIKYSIMVIFYVLYNMDELRDLGLNTCQYYSKITNWLNFLVFKIIFVLMHTSQHFKPFHASVGSGTMFDNEPEKAPAPNSYRPEEARTLTKSTNVGTTIKFRHKERALERSPAPHDYEVAAARLSTENSPPAYSVGIKDGRDYISDAIKKSATNGPGQFALKSTLNRSGAGSLLGRHDMGKPD